MLKAAGDPMRLEILRVLCSDSFGVLELCHIFQAKQSGMSHHLKVMANAGLVSTRREGNSIFYWRSPVLSNAEFKALREAMNKTLDGCDLSCETQSRIQDIYDSRSQAAQDFFAEHSNKFRETQELIAGFEVYGPLVADVLTKSALKTKEKALEIGPGEGLFLNTLATDFDEVTALDITPAMLEKSQINNCAFNNIDYVCSDTDWCKSNEECFDAVVINMVLHHTPSPRSLFADASTSLKNNGVLLVCDLCRHEQDWVKEACGDLWQGFEPQELQTWANENNLTEGQSSFLALRNGFQIQIQQFLKN